jgi:flavodoxin I
MSRIAIFFGPEKGSVNRVANKICAAIGPEKVDMVSVKNANADDLEKYDKILFGISTVGKETWDSSYTSDWGRFMPEISKVNFQGKTVAIFGLGDHITYANAFVDFMALLAEKLIPNQATIVGQVPADEYEFEESKAVIDGKFIGLPIDEDFEPELTDKRIANWLQLIKKDFDF